MLLVIAAVSVISFAVIYLATYMDSVVDTEAHRAKVFRARQLAESGTAVGYSSKVKPWDPVLSKKWSETESFKTTISPEGGRLAINTILLSGDQKILQRLFKLWEFSQADAQTAIDSMLDWIDSNNDKLGNGAEQAQYAALGFPTHPSNRVFATTSEIQLVNSFPELLKKKPDLLDSFTVWSGGKLDINSASAELISAVCDVSIEKARTFVTTRNGADKLPFTEDDLLYTNLNQEEIHIALGLSAEQYTAKLPLLTINDTTTRIRSVGTVGNISKAMTVIVRRNENRSTEVLWLER